MAPQAGSFAWVVRIARAAAIAVVAAMVLAAIYTIFQFVDPLMHGPASFEAVGRLAVMLSVEIAIGLLAVLAYGVAAAVVSNEQAVRRLGGAMDRQETLLNEVVENGRQTVELMSLSDQARSLLFRDKEIENFREAAHSDFMHQDYKTAALIIEKMETEFGYIDEAARLREEMEASKKSTLDEKISKAIARIDEIVARRDWARAFREAKRVVRLFPDNEKVRSLPERIEAARDKHKRDLLHAYGEAVRKNDVDRGIELLQELDQYLTPQEGAALAESARGVFRARLHNLGVQFAIHVTEKAWAEAVQAGEEIVREFPNSRMAQEVRSKMDQLKARAEAG